MIKVLTEDQITLQIIKVLKEGKKKGATKAYLQVVEGNTPARNLYESLGLHYLYTYWFRVQTHTN